MKRLQLPQNKLVRLALNIAFIPIWFWLNNPGLYPPSTIGRIWLPIFTSIFGNDPYHPLIKVVDLLIRFLPIILVTRYIWWGRVKPRPRITRSKEDAE